MNNILQCEIFALFFFFFFFFFFNNYYLFTFLFQNCKFVLLTLLFVILFCFFFLFFFFFFFFFFLMNIYTQFTCRFRTARICFLNQLCLSTISFFSLSLSNLFFKFNYIICGRFYLPHASYLPGF